MKVGILTIPIETGYGSILQAYALKTALMSRGHNVIFIRRERYLPVFSMIRIFRRLVKKYIFGYRDTVILVRLKEIREFPIVMQNIQPFLDKYLAPFTEKYYSSREMEKVNALELDAIVVGSDQVWRPGYMDNIEDYFLYQIKDSIHKYAYAASLAVDDWTLTNKETKKCKKAVEKFSSISVREQSSVLLCKKHLGVTPVHVLDPTLLFDMDFYKKIIENHEIIYERKLCTYILDENEVKKSIINCYSQQLGVEVFKSNTRTEDRNAPIEERIAPSVAAWLDAFASSMAICTDSFHGTLFSIIFKKDFVVIVNKGRGAERFNSILQILNLTNRIVTSCEQISHLEPIDWDDVYMRLKEQRVISNDFLDSIK